MMIVVVIIGLFAALAAPSVVSLTRDQRTRRESLAVMDVYRQARARSLGRGSAVNVNYQIDVANQSTFTSQEALDNFLPSPNCQTYPWAAGLNGSLPVTFSVREPGKATDFPVVQLTGTVWASTTANPAGAVASNYIDICFTPKGRIFYRLAAGSAYQQLTGRAEFAVQRKETITTNLGIIRVVQVNADGTTKMRL